MRAVTTRARVIAGYRLAGGVVTLAVTRVGNRLRARLRPAVP